MSKFQVKMTRLNLMKDVIVFIDIELNNLEKFTSTPDRSDYVGMDEGQSEKDYFNQCVAEINRGIYRGMEDIDKVVSFESCKTLKRLVIDPEINRQKRRLNKAIWAERTRWDKLV